MAGVVINDDQQVALALAVVMWVILSRATAELFR
jgi:hypothetical protein